MTDLERILAIAGGCLTLGLFVGAIGMAYGRFIAHLKAYSAGMKELRERLSAVEERASLLERNDVIMHMRSGFKPPPPSSSQNRASSRPNPRAPAADEDDDDSDEGEP